MNNVIDQIVESSLPELADASRVERFKAATYAGVAVVGVAIGENNHGISRKVAKSASIVTGMMAWYHGSKAMVLGNQSIESQLNLIEYRNDRANEDIVDFIAKNFTQS
jgi:hypothetical protein